MPNTFPGSEQLVLTYGSIPRGFDKGQATIIIFLDLSAALDIIDPEELLQIMDEELGKGGVALEWFQSFLKGRTHRVKVHSEYSERITGLVLQISHKKDLEIYSLDKRRPQFLNSRKPCFKQPH